MNPIQKKRADYEAAIAAIQAKLAVLAELEAELGETPAVAPPPPPTPPAKPAATPPAAETHAGKALAPAPPPAAGRTVDRVAAALSGGPLRVQDLGERLPDVSPAAISQCLRGNDRLFEKIDPNHRFSPYRLTAEGESHARRLTPAPAT